MPDVYHRWVAINAIATLLGRSVSLQFGIKPVYPNQYILVLGNPGVRKSTALKYGERLIKGAGYKRLAPDRMSRQAFVTEMHFINQPEQLGLKLEEMLDMEVDYPHEMGISAGEFVDFIGQHDQDYLMLLTTLWDNPDEYRNPKIKSTSISVHKPTVNLIGAATPENLQLAFPVGAMDTGTLSRFLFVHGEATGKKVLFPKPPNKDVERQLTKKLMEIGKLEGDMWLEDEALEIIDWIYTNAQPLTDPRFAHYNGRRLQHLLKLVIVCAASDLRLNITSRDVLVANTILGLTEHNMPAALGHFGRSKQSATMHAILEWIKSMHKPVQTMEIYKQFAADFNSEREFQGCLQDLQNSGKLLPISKGATFLGCVVKEEPFAAWLKPLMLTDILTTQELSTIGLAKASKELS